MPTVSLRPNAIHHLRGKYTQTHTEEKQQQLPSSMLLDRGEWLTHNIKMCNVFYCDLRKNNKYTPTFQFHQWYWCLYILTITHTTMITKVISAIYFILLLVLDTITYFFRCELIMTLKSLGGIVVGIDEWNIVRVNYLIIYQKCMHHLIIDNLVVQILYIIRENEFIQIIDIRKNGYEYKNIDLWRSKLISNKNKNNNKNKIYNNIEQTTHRARIDDGIILESMNSAILKLQNNSLVNIHLESETINKTYSFENNIKKDMTTDEIELINVSFLSNVNQRRMCNFNDYGMPQIIMSGSFGNECVCVDMSSEFDMYEYEKEYREKRVNLGLMDNDNLDKNGNEFCSAKSLVVNKENIENELYKKSYGFMAKAKLMNIMTCCSLHPKSLYAVCGTLDNSVEIVACASNPF